jgi:hypothetical protein
MPETNGGNIRLALKFPWCSQIQPEDSLNGE